MRLRELSCPDVDHTWLWKLNPRRGPILNADEFVDAVCFRLGCAGPVEPTVVRRLQHMPAGHWGHSHLLLCIERGHAWTQPCRGRLYSKRLTLVIPLPKPRFLISSQALAQLTCLLRRCGHQWEKGHDPFKIISIVMRCWHGGCHCHTVKLTVW